MCQNCKASEKGIQRQAEFTAATEALKALNINPATAGFIARHAYQGTIPCRYRGSMQITEEEQAALKRYNDAQDAMKKLHEDYVWDLARKNAEEARARGVKQFYIVHGDKR